MQKSIAGRWALNEHNAPEFAGATHITGQPAGITARMLVSHVSSWLGLFTTEITEFTETKRGNAMNVIRHFSVISVYSVANLNHCM